MIIDRRLQRKILEAGKMVYPDTITEENDRELWGMEFFSQNTAYLMEHGLIDAMFADSFSSNKEVAQFRITSRGIDFLEDDGGLSAILDRVVIKFDESDLKKLLSVKIEQAGVPEKEKASIMATIKSLPSEGIKTVYTGLLNLGLKNLPDALQLIQRAQENLI